MKQIIASIAVFSVLFVNGQNWNQLGLDIDGETVSDESGWSVSMNANGDRVAIGAPWNFEGGSIAGHVRIYEWSDYGWVQLGLDIDGEAPDSAIGMGTNDMGLGISVSINAIGDRVAIGMTSGNVRIYDWSGTAWVQVGLDIEKLGRGKGYYRYKGYPLSLSADGNRVAIGAPLNHGGIDADLSRMPSVSGTNQQPGRVIIYEWSGTAWIQLGLVIYGFPGDLSGWSVSMNTTGDRVAIGAPGNDIVRVFEWSGTAWVQLGLDIDRKKFSRNRSSGSGHVVSLNASGDRVAIVSGGYKNRNDVRVFEWSGTAWVQLGLDFDYPAPKDFYSVSINSVGDRVAIGVSTSSGNGRHSGKVSVFEWRGTKWVQLGLVINGEAAYDLSGHSVSMNANGDRVAIGAPHNDGGKTLKVFGEDFQLGERQNPREFMVVYGPRDKAPHTTMTGHVRVYEFIGDTIPPEIECKDTIEFSIHLDSIFYVLPRIRATDNVMLDSAYYMGKSKNNYYSVGEHNLKIVAIDNSQNRSECLTVLKINKVKHTEGKEVLDAKEVLSGDRIDKIHNFNMNYDTLTLFIYDNQKADGDSVSIIYNDEVIIHKAEIKVGKKNIIKRLVYLDKNTENKLIIKAWNNGEIPPNTLKIDFYRGNLLSKKLGKLKPIKSEVLYSSPGKATEVNLLFTD